MRELLNLRQENAKTFALANGKGQLELHIGAIHYKDDYSNSIEQWKDIDLTWEGNKITKAPYELTRDGNKFTFKDKKTGEISTIERTSVFPPGIGFEVVPEFSAVRFRHTLPSDKIPFEASFKVTGKGLITTKAFDDEGELELETSLVAGILTEKLSQVKDKQTGKIRPVKGQIKIDPTWQVGASTDDAYRRITPSFWSLSHSQITAGGAAEGTIKWGAGMRFTNITIAGGSTISSAYLTLVSDINKAGVTVNTRISAEDVDNAATFANNAAAFDIRWAARTTARVDWDAIPAWTVGVAYDSPEIKTVIQEIIDRVGWASGQAIVIFWEDYDDRSSHVNDGHRTARSYDGSTTQAPQLTITYTEAGSAYFGILKRWTGAAWAKAKLMVYTGTWVQKPLKRWDGSEWKEVDATG